MMTRVMPQFEASLLVASFTIVTLLWVYSTSAGVESFSRGPLGTNSSLYRTSD